jgi:cytochrome c-type biogenesis protein CcsB
VLESALRCEVLGHWAAVGLYSAASVCFVWGAASGGERGLRWGLVPALLGLFPHGAAILLRWAEAGHGPYISRVEVLSSNAWVALAMFLGAAAWRPRLRAAGFVVVPAALLLTAWGLMTDPAVRTLPPSLRSPWLVFHVVFAKLAAGGVLLAVATAALYLMKEARPSRPLCARLPTLGELDEHGRRFAFFGFVFWSVMIAAGAIWANESWGRYWSWDPIEVWSLATWLALGAYLHLRRFRGLEGRRAAWFLGACFAFSMATVFFVPFLAGSVHTEYFK